jgi:GNAT superfamily N-acetyltransferase
MLWGCQLLTSWPGRPSSVELIGGFAVLVGAFVTAASIPLAVVLLVAMFTVHLQYGFSSIKLVAVTAAGAQSDRLGTKLTFCISPLSPPSLWAARVLSRSTAFGHVAGKSGMVPEELAMYTIAAAEPRHLPLLPAIELAAASLLAGYAPKSVLAETTSQADLEQAQQHGQLWVALSGGVSVGFAHVKVLEPGAAHLEEIDVHPEHGRRGIGRRLVIAVCQWAAANGYSMRHVDDLPGCTVEHAVLHAESGSRRFRRMRSARR